MRRALVLCLLAAALAGCFFGRQPERGVLRQTVRGEAAWTDTDQVLAAYLCAFEHLHGRDVARAIMSVDLRLGRSSDAPFRGRVACTTGGGAYPTIRVAADLYPSARASCIGHELAQHRAPYVLESDLNALHAPRWKRYHLDKVVPVFSACFHGRPLP